MCPNNPQQDGADDFFERFKSGDAAAFKVIYDRYGRQLKMIMNVFVEDRQAAEDIVAHAFEKLFDNRSRINDEKHIYGYLYRTAYNQAIEHFRSKKRQDAMAGELKHLAAHEDIDPVEGEAAWTQLMDKIKLLIGQLPRARQRIFRMRYCDGLDNEVIASTLALSRQTVINQLNLALGFLRSELRK